MAPKARPTPNVAVISTAVIVLDWTLYNSSKGGHVPSMAGRENSGSSDRLDPIRKATSRPRKEGGSSLRMNNTGNTWWGLKIGHPRQSFLLTGGPLIRKRTVNSEKNKDTLIYIGTP